MEEYLRVSIPLRADLTINIQVYVYINIHILNRVALINNYIFHLENR